MTVALNLKPFFILSACLLCLSGCKDMNGDFEYVAIGASDAVGIGATPLDNGYVFRIKDGLEADGRDVGLLNLGIPDANSDLIDEAETPVAIEEDPELVTIFVGSNDVIDGVTPEAFQNTLDEMLNNLQTKTDALLVIGTLPDLTKLPRFKDGADEDVTTARINAFNAIIVSEAEKNGAVIADLSAGPVLDSEVSDDGLHPNDQGYERIANIFLAVIRKNLP